VNCYKSVIDQKNESTYPINDSTYLDIKKVINSFNR